MSAVVLVTDRTEPAPQKAFDAVQDTNILRMVAEGLQREYPAVLARIAQVEREREALYAYRDQLHRVAVAADVPMPSPAPDEMLFGSMSW